MIDANNIKKRLKESHVQIVTLFHSEYPELLSHIPNPPVILYCKGDVKLLKNEHKISVVGTRNPNDDGLKIVNYLLKPMAKEWVIVSGLAKGIDVRSHEIAISENGKTIAVTAGGFHHLYPREHQKIAEKINLLISLYPPETRVQRWMFPERNRLISGLSHGTLVVQAKKRSGSLITADFALEQGREVFTPPCALFDTEFDGNLHLLQEGATVVYSYVDIVNELKPRMKMFDLRMK